MATTQPPTIKILSATAKGHRTKLQAAIAGSTAAIRRYRVRLDARTVAQLQPRRPNFTVTLSRRGTRVRVEALDASGRVLARAARRVATLRNGKRDVGTGGRVGT